MSKKSIMIWQRKESKELLGQSNCPIMLDSCIMKNEKNESGKSLLGYTLEDNPVN